MAMPEACEVTLGEGAFPKGGWDRVAILGSHEQPNQPQSASWSPHLPPKRQLYSRSHSPDYLISPRTSAATTGWAGLTPKVSFRGRPRGSPEPLTVRSRASATRWT
jgi:hypothetical protein